MLLFSLVSVVCFADCEVRWAGHSRVLEQSVTDRSGLDEVLSFLASLEVSAATVKAFTGRLERHEVLLSELTPATLKRTRVGEGTISLFGFVGDMPVVWLSRSEFGRLAVHVFHEAVHAQDELYAARSRESRAVTRELQAERATLVNEEQIDAWEGRALKALQHVHRMAFAAERLAYDRQYELVQEMEKKFDCAGDYLRGQSEKQELIIDHLSDEAIADSYGLKKVWVLEKKRD